MEEAMMRNSAVNAFVFAVTIVVTLAGFGAQTSPNQKRVGSTPGGGNQVAQPSGFYCNTKALSKTERERYNQLTDKFRQARIETKELKNGYAFRLKSEAVSVAELAEWISAERKCCPFFGFEIELQRNGGPLWLKLRGAEGIKAFIRAEFKI
jgi:hypothetical protein